MRSFLLACVFLSSASAFASVKAYVGPAAEKLFIEDAPQLGKNIALVKFEGPASKWTGKVIKVTREKVGDSERYSFGYDLELSNGVHKRTYMILAEAGYELVKGSRVRQIELYTQEGGKNPLLLNHDAELTKESQKIGLAAEYKKSAYKPDVD